MFPADTPILTICANPLMDMLYDVSRQTPISFIVVTSNIVSIPPVFVGF
jgi:hypothetical protein